MPYKSGINRGQVSLLPETIDDYITEDNAVQFIDAFAEYIGLGKIMFKYSKTFETGRSPYDYKDLLKLYLYGYINWYNQAENLRKNVIEI